MEQPASLRCSRLIPVARFFFVQKTKIASIS
jgi:hypothetical protein